MGVAEIRRRLHALRVKTEPGDSPRVRRTDGTGRDRRSLRPHSSTHAPRRTLQPLCHARAVIQIHVGGRRRTLPHTHAAEIGLGQMIVFGEDARQIRLGEAESGRILERPAPLREMSKRASFIASTSL